MSASLSDVVAQLRVVVANADRAAVAATRAQADAESAHVTFDKAGRGTDHPRMRQAVTEARTAAEKLGRTANLLTKAADAFTDYLNLIAPGSAPARHATPEATRRATPDALPSGEHLESEAAARQRRLDRLNAMITKKADDLQDSATDLAEIAHRAFTVGQRPHGSPTLGVPPSTPTVVAQQPPASRPEAGDLVSNLVIAASALWIGGNWASRKLHNAFKRSQTDAE